MATTPTSGSAIDAALRVLAGDACMTAALSLEGASRTFKNGAGIFDIDLELPHGQIVALVGLNGAGKSTLMRVMLGMLRPQSGHVRLGGHALASAPMAEWAKVGHLVEYPLAYPELTADATSS